MLYAFIECLTFRYQSFAVITYDQPLFALAKSIQCQWPEKYGEQTFVIVLAYWDAAWKVVGNWLENSGWVEASSRRLLCKEMCFLLVLQIHRSKFPMLHAQSKHTKLLQGHSPSSMQPTRFIEGKNAQVCESKQGWINTRKRESPQFQHWLVALEVLVLSFVISLRSANFQLYLECITKLTPCFFSLDHPN